jgi:cyclic pyranopterin monophosphate synthase
VIVCSDSVSSGNASDGSGPAVVEKLKTWNINTRQLEVVPDDENTIQDQLLRAAEANTDLLIFVGGTGVSPRDVTPEAVAPLLDRQIPGVMESARAYGRERTPFAMLSRGVAGFKGKMLVLTLPGSPKGAIETLEAVFPHVLHAFKVMEGNRH